MKKEITLTAFEDHNGSLGWGIGTLDNTFEELDACFDGNLLAHDIIEHNPHSHLSGVENELEALGAAEYVRGALWFDSDLIAISRHVLNEGVSRPHGELEEINGYMLEACKSFDSELGFEWYGTEERKNLRDYIKYASTYMQQGHDWASKYYANVNVGAMFTAIRESFNSPEFEGQQMKLSLDFNKLSVVWDELWEDEEIW